MALASDPLCRVVEEQEAEWSDVRGRCSPNVADQLWRRKSALGPSSQSVQGHVVQGTVSNLRCLNASAVYQLAEPAEPCETGEGAQSGQCPPLGTLARDFQCEMFLSTSAANAPSLVRGPVWLRAGEPIQVVWPPNPGRSATTECPKVLAAEGPAGHASACRDSYLRTME